MHALEVERAVVRAEVSLDVEPSRKVLGDDRPPYLVVRHLVAPARVAVEVEDGEPARRGELGVGGLFGILLGERVLLSLGEVVRGGLPGTAGVPGAAAETGHRGGDKGGGGAQEAPARHGRALAASLPHRGPPMANR